MKRYNYIFVTLCLFTFSFIALGKYVHLYKDVNKKNNIDSVLYYESADEDNEESLDTNPNIIDNDIYFLSNANRLYNLLTLKSFYLFNKQNTSYLSFKSIKDKYCKILSLPILYHSLKIDFIS